MTHPQVPSMTVPRLTIKAQKVSGGPTPGNLHPFPKILWITLPVIVCVLSRSVMSDSATPWTVACQASLFMGILQARILEWVALPSIKGSSQPSNPSQISCIAGEFFTVWATSEAQEYWSEKPIPFKVITNIEIASQVAQVVKNQPANADVERRGFDP